MRAILAALLLAGCVEEAGAPRKMQTGDFVGWLIPCHDSNGRTCYRKASQICEHGYVTAGQPIKQDGWRYLAVRCKSEHHRARLA